MWRVQKKSCVPTGRGGLTRPPALATVREVKPHGGTDYRSSSEEEERGTERARPQDQNSLCVYDRATRGISGQSRTEEEDEDCLIGQLWRVQKAC